MNANPNIAAIQEFNRLLIKPGATTDELLPFVSREYDYAGEDFNAFVRDSLPFLVGFPEGFHLCAIGIIEEKITIHEDSATNIITTGQSGTLAGVNPDFLLEQVAHVTEQYDFVKESDGRWRFVALRTRSGGFVETRRGYPPPQIIIGTTLPDELLPGEQFEVDATIIPDIEQVSMELRWSPTGVDGQTTLVPGDHLKLTLQFGDPSTTLPQGIDFVALTISGNSTEGQRVQNGINKVFKIPAPSAVIDAEPPPPPLPPGTTNLARALGTITRVSSSFPGFGPARAIDGNLLTSWFTARGDAANLGTVPFYEAILPTDAVVSRINMFGNRQFPRGFDFFAGRFELFDPNNALLFDSGVVDLPAPDRDISLSIPNIRGVRKVRFTATADESDEPGFAELEIIGTFQ
jgi:hypothetical protein